MLNMINNMFEMNNMISRVMSQKATFNFVVTASALEGELELDEFEIRTSKGECITTKMALTILHNICMAIEDSRYKGVHFKHYRQDGGTFKVICKGSKGLITCTSVMKQEIKKTHDRVMKCKSDIRNIADEFGLETVKHVLDKKQQQVI